MATIDEMRNSRVTENKLGHFGGTGNQSAPPGCNRKHPHSRFGGFVDYQGDVIDRRKQLLFQYRDTNYVSLNAGHPFQILLNVARHNCVHVRPLVIGADNGLSTSAGGHVAQARAPSQKLSAIQHGRSYAVGGRIRGAAPRESFSVG